MARKTSRLLTLAVLVVLVTSAAYGQDTPNPTQYAEPLSDRLVSYDIVADLDVDAKAISGIERITWRNPGKVPVGELQFHLYLNAFSGPESTFMQESGGRHRGFEAQSENPWGGVDVTDIRIVDESMLPHGDFSSLPLPTANEAGQDLTPAIEYIRPDDGNEEDFTVMRVVLPEPVQAGETITLNVEFTSRLPEIIARTGWKKKKDGSPFFMIGQWFPKLGVYEVPGQRYVPADAEKGQWNTHQFHMDSEFYADFGSYRVTMTVPDNYAVGASGIRVSESAADGRKTIVNEAADVHDFAWTASPEMQVFTDRWEKVDIRLLVQPEHAGQAKRHIEAAKVALQHFNDWYGEYPYTTLTLVDGVGGSNGMEYPTLITCGTVYALPNWFRFLELVLIHEFGHQYWYGMLASNEFEEAWLDEGINSYTEMKIMDDAYGPGAVLDIPSWRISDTDMQRLSYTKNGPTRDQIFMKSWEYGSDKSYGLNSYAKPATVLHTLENYVGLEKMRTILRTYYDRWRFRHPTTRDFIDVANEVAGEDLSWFFDQFIYSSVAVDYRVAHIGNRKVSPDSAETPDYRSRVDLERAEEGIIPVQVVVRFESGRTDTLDWDGRDRWKTLKYGGPDKVAEVFIDPLDRVPLDINRANNRMTIDAGGEAARKYGLKFIVWLQQFFQVFAGLI